MTAPHGAVHPSEDAGVPKDHLVWSMEHDAWWGPDHCGYRQNILHAGLYTQAEAEEIVRGSTYGEHVREKAVPLSEVERDYFRPMASGTFGASLKLGSAVSPVPAPTPEAVQQALAAYLVVVEHNARIDGMESVAPFHDEKRLAAAPLRAALNRLLATPQPPREGEIHPDTALLNDLAAMLHDGGTIGDITISGSLAAPHYTVQIGSPRDRSAHESDDLRFALRAALVFATPEGR